mgnify:CR=1 FL=1
MLVDLDNFIFDVGAFLNTACRVEELIIRRIKQPVPSGLDIFKFFKRFALGEIFLPKPVYCTPSLTDHIELETLGHAESAIFCADVVFIPNILVSDCLKVDLGRDVKPLFAPVQAGDVVIGPELASLMEVDLVLGQVFIVLVLVTQEQANASIKPRKTVLRGIISEAVANGVNKAVQVRHPVLPQQILRERLSNFKIFCSVLTFCARFTSRSVARLSPPQSSRHRPRPI